MFTLSFLRPRSSKIVPPPPPSPSHQHFHLLAQLQLAVHDDSLISSSDLISGSNDPNLRRQGKLCFTFATRNHSFSNTDRLRVADDLEKAVDAAYSGEDYRRRVYDIGGWVTVDEELVRDLVEKRVSAGSVVVGGKGARNSRRTTTTMTESCGEKMEIMQLQQMPACAVMA